MRPLKIAFLSRWYAEETRRFGEEEGGPVRQLTEAVAERGHEIVVLTQSPDVTGLKKARIGSLETWLFPRDRKRDFLTGLRDKGAKQLYHHRKLYSDAFALRDFLARRGPFDILWTQGEEPDGLVAAFAAKQGISLPPLLVQIYALRYRFQNGKPLFHEKKALRLAFQKADRIIANSQLVAHTLSAYSGPGLTAKALAEKTRVVEPNLHREFLRAAEKTSDLPAAESGRVLFLGALNEKKGALVFLEALSQTEAARKGATFAVLGGFTEQNSLFTQRWHELLEKTRRHLSSTQLELLGAVSPGEVIRQIRRASVVILPSLFDEFSRALVECLVLSRPVITTRGVGAWPLVQDHGCGLVIEPGNAIALAQAMDEALRPGQPYATHAGHLAHRLLHEFSPEAIARQMEHHLSEVAFPSTA